ncbi:MAG: winged helix-turn-helix transcriptional regulator [Porphyromonadaceae bacterium]|nr:winged helix-turn-helix transcriptional regulator [Porphyromonadaceae bacterium]
MPEINLDIKQVDGKALILLHISSGKETPYYYVGDKQRLAYIRIGNETVVADRVQLKSLVLKGSGRTFDSLPSPYKFEMMEFSRLKSVYFKRTRRSFENSDYASWGIINENGELTNAGALVADESPVRQSRIFCTRWNGLTMSGGLVDALDDVELEGSVIHQLQEAETFVRRNSHKKWWKEAYYREELPDYPERAVAEAVTNAILHRDYTVLGSEVHIDMYDDRVEIYSPGGMFSGEKIQNLDPMTVPSRRRNPLLADFFTRLGLMERRGSGFKKIIEAYQCYDHLLKCRMPEFRSDSDEFHVTLFNQGYQDNVEPPLSQSEESLKERKEFAKATREIYKLVSRNPKVTIEAMSKSLGLSKRQILRHLKRLRESGKITRVGGNKGGEWKITDEDYTKFFDRIMIPR